MTVNSFLIYHVKIYTLTRIFPMLSICEQAILDSETLYFLHFYF